MEKEMKNIMLLSYPRSGSNFLGYIIENFFKIKMVGIAGHQFGYKNDVEFRKDIQINVMHFSSGNHLTELKETYEVTFKREIVKQDALLLLCRNYHNCIKSQYDRSPKKKTFTQFLKEAGPMYVNNLNDYENFNKDKELIRYEDLTFDVGIILDQIKLLVDRIDKNILTDMSYEKEKKKFLSEIEMHSEKSDNFYKKGPGGNRILRNSTTFFDDRILQGIDNFIKSLDPKTYDKYLKIYKSW